MRTPILLFLLALPACSESYEHDPAPKPGELGVGAFLYRCPTAGDPACPGGVLIAPAFPEAFARGSRISLTYTWADDADHYNDPLPQLESPVLSLLRRDGDRFIALATGYAPILAVTGNSQVVDLVHLWLREVDALKAVDTADPSAVSLLELKLAEGDTAELQGFPVDGDGVRLGGVLPQSWASADPTVLAIVAGGDTGLVRVEARGVGATTLTLTLGEHALALPVTVEADPDPTTGDGTDTGGATGTGTTGATDGSDSSGDSTGSSSIGTSSTGDTTGGVL